MENASGPQSLSDPLADHVRFEQRKRNLQRGLYACKLAIAIRDERRKYNRVTYGSLLFVVCPKICHPTSMVVEDSPVGSNSLHSETLMPKTNNGLGESGLSLVFARGQASGARLHLIFMQLMSS